MAWLQESLPKLLFGLPLRTKSVVLHYTLCEWTYIYSKTKFDHRFTITKFIYFDYILCIFYNSIFCRLVVATFKGCVKLKHLLMEYEVTRYCLMLIVPSTIQSTVFKHYLCSCIRAQKTNMKLALMDVAGALQGHDWSSLAWSSCVLMCVCVLSIFPLHRWQCSGWA